MGEHVGLDDLDVPPRYRLKTRADVQAMPEPTWRIEGIVPDGGLGLIHGATGAFKSFVMLDMWAHVATGRAWCGHPVKQGDVVYIAAEGQAGIRRRLLAWEEAHGVNTDRLYWVTDAPNFMRAEDVTDLIAAFGNIKPVLIGVDTLARTIVPGNESATQDMGIYLDGLANVQAKTGAGAWLVHHPGHGNPDRPRGAYSLMAAVDTTVSVTRPNGTYRVTLTCEKQKDGEPFADINLELDKVALEAMPGHDSLAVRWAPENGANAPLSQNAALALKVLAEMGDSAISATDWQALCEGLPRRTFFRAKAELEAKDRIVNVGTAARPKWMVPMVPNGANGANGTEGTNSATVPPPLRGWHLGTNPAPGTLHYTCAGCSGTFPDDSPVPGFPRIRCDDCLTKVPADALVTCAGCDRADMVLAAYDKAGAPLCAACADEGVKAP